MQFRRSPVFIARGLSLSHSDTVRPRNNEKPRMKRFLELFMSTVCRLEIPTAVIIPVRAQRIQLVTDLV